MTGARVGIAVDLGANLIEFIVNNESIKTMSLLDATEVCVAVCLGGLNQLVSITDTEVRPASIIPSEPPLVWDVTALGPDCLISNFGRTVTRTSSDAWGIQRVSNWCAHLG